MLILVFRGIFLLGILSWYSTNVWKMIDEYFKDRFDKYLQREYQKNPKMREDIDAYGTPGENGKKNIYSGDSVKISETEKNPKSNSEPKKCETISGLNEDSCPFDPSNMEPEADATSSGVEEMKNNDPSTEVKVTENAVLPEKSFLEIPSKAEKNSENQLAKNDSSESISLRESIDTDNVDKTVFPEFTKKHDASEASTTKQIVRDPSSRKSNENVEKRSKMSKPVRQRSSQDRRKSETADDKSKTKKKMKKKVKTITLTDEDFRQAKLKARLMDYDFSEFDNDDYDDENEAVQGPPEGILVSQLPFKPRADIGNLERVTAEEFCPLNVEDEANCGETKIWP